MNLSPYPHHLLKTVKYRVVIGFQYLQLNKPGWDWTAEYQDCIHAIERQVLNLWSQGAELHQAKFELAYPVLWVLFPDRTGNSLGTRTMGWRLGHGLVQMDTMGTCHK